MILKAIPTGEYDQYGKYIGGYRYEMSCDICGQTYISNTKRQHKYCSLACAKKGNNKLKSAKQKVIRQATKQEKSCKHCGKMFLPSRSDSSYCSNACKQVAYRERKQVHAMYKMTVLSLPEKEWFDSDGQVSFFGVPCANIHNTLENLTFKPEEFSFEVEEIDYKQQPELASLTRFGSLPFVVYMKTGCEKPLLMSSGEISEKDIKFIMKRIFETGTV